MLNNLKTSLFGTRLRRRGFALLLSPFACVLSPAIGFAQAPAAPSEMTTICRYDPNSGLPNAFGMRTFITLTASEGNTAFLLERFPSVLSNPDSVEQRADIAETRSLTLYDTSIVEARQLMLDQPFYYAALLGVNVADLDAGFEVVDATLGCGQVAANPVPAPSVDSPESSSETPPAEMPSSEMPSPEMPSASTISDLPNGNYRFASAEFSERIVTDEELLEAGGALFLFRKFGDTVTGTFGYIDDEGGSCLTGTVEGNTVTGDSYAAADSVREGNFLTLGTEVEDGSYEGSVLNLADFSRINAGTRLPVESCS